MVLEVSLVLNFNVVKELLVYSLEFGIHVLHSLQVYLSSSFPKEPVQEGLSSLIYQNLQVLGICSYTPEVW